MGHKGMGSHQSALMKTDTWLTPPHILEALGTFMLDPCTPEHMPWETARYRFTKKEDGYTQNWFGRVFLNPPYGLEATKWLQKLADHGNGVALIFARTETEMFFDTVWKRANALLFIKGRLYFHREDGTRADANAGAPSVLVAYGEKNALQLKNCGIEGQFIQLR